MPRKKALSEENLGSSLCKIVLCANGSEYKSSARNFIDALEKINLGVIKTKGVLNVSIEKLKTKEILIPPVQMRRLTYNRMYREIFQKRVISLLR